RQQPAEYARRLLRRDGLPHERERAEPRDAARGDGAPGEVPTPDDPRLRLRGELRAADARAADGRDQPHFPRKAGDDMRSEQLLQPTQLEGKSPYELR